MVDYEWKFVYKDCDRMCIVQAIIFQVMLIDSSACAPKTGIYPDGIDWLIIPPFSLSPISKISAKYIPPWKVKSFAVM